MTSQRDLGQQVRDWVLANRQPGTTVTELNDATDLIGSGILDSVGFVQLLAFAETLTGNQIDLTDIDPDAFTTLGGFCSYAFRESGPLTTTA